MTAAPEPCAIAQGRMSPSVERRLPLSAQLRLGVCCITAVVFLSTAQVSHAEEAVDRRSPAPIVYASLSPRVQAAPVIRSAPARSTGSASQAAPIDLRPGAVRRASFATGAVAKLPDPSALDGHPAGGIDSRGQAVPYAGPPYEIDGKWFVPAHEPDYNEVGIASWYGPGFQGKPTASGEIFDARALTAAHPTLPIPSLVKVTNLLNGRTLIVRINDRGPYKDDRIIDLSQAAAEKLGVRTAGKARVRVEYVGPAPAEPNSVPPQAQEGPIPAAFEVTESRHPASRTIEAGPLGPVAIPATPAPAPSIPAARERPNAATGYFLQAGAFADLGNAHRLRARLGAEAKAQVVSATVNGSELYKVMLGPWALRAEANAAREQFSAAGAGAFLIIEAPR